MKRIKNESFQSFTIFLNTNKGCTEHWLQPGKSVVVPAAYITEQIKTMASRRLLKIESYA